ncbi:MAG: hypothetical protein KKA84_13105 [Bacteroidetes bacterium]|nr:hypothetical protein [Bacteroidota bacterium]
MSLKKDLINHIEEMANLMDFLGENKFKVSAFKNGSNTIRQLTTDIEVMIAEDSLKEVKGIGKGLLTVIMEYFDHGYSSEHERLLEEVPKGITEVFKVRGLGAKKIKSLYDELKIRNLEDLEVACKDRKIINVKGFTANTVEKILAEIERIRSAKGYIHLHRADKVVKILSDILAELDSVIQYSVSGDFRRGMEIISELIFCCHVSNKITFEEELAKLFPIKTLTDSSENVIEFEFDSKISPKIFISENESEYFRNLFRTTGSNEFIEDLVFEKEDLASEEELFELNNMRVIIPEMREKEYLDAPEHLRDNSNLTFDNFKGLMHFHTTYSDGLNTLEEMVVEAKNLGFSYAAVCDHSKTAFYANGLSEKRILLQKKEIEELSSSLDFTIFQGIESDILNDGSLDYEDEVLKMFDFIVASIHSNFSMDEAKMTSRIIKAIENPYTDVLGHPTGRLLLSRDPFPHNIHKIIDACAANNVAIELNANPHRLDLDWRHIYYARGKGCKFSINADAHSTEGLIDHKYGIKVARKGGMQVLDVINCYDKTMFIEFINRKVKRN